MKKKFLCVFLICILTLVLVSKDSLSGLVTTTKSDGKNLIKWVDFDVTYQALEDAMNVDIETYQQDIHVGWVDILSYLATKYGGDFSMYSHKDITNLVSAINGGSSMDELTRDMKYYPYYHQAYSAIIGNMMGLDKDGNYGLNAYSPVGAGYWYNDSDDFGNGRDYGFARKHLGHDMFCSVGTPVMAVESGRVEALGWNQYGGWRIGIRSNDGKRYYYYAHLRKDTPYAKGLKEGDKVKAGQLIGYTGQTGYSRTENVNNINVPHLHFGMQLIFDEAQKECNSEIWIDTYALIRLLSKHKSEATSPTSKAVAPTSKPVSTPPVDVPILMYHGLTNKPKQVNEYFIPTYTFESDLKYLNENGYTTVTTSQLIQYVYDKTGTVQLPEKPVVLSFDDGYYNNLSLGSPLLKKYGMKGVLSVIGSACQEASDTEYRSLDYCNATWDQVKEMSDSGLWEIQNHTYAMHQLKGGRKGARINADEEMKEYKKILRKDLSALQQKVKETTGKTPDTFAWPFGAITEEARDVLKDLGIKSTFSCRGGINSIKKGDTEGLFLLKRNLRTPKASIAKLLSE